VEGEHFSTPIIRFKRNRKKFVAFQVQILYLSKLPRLQACKRQDGFLEFVQAMTIATMLILWWKIVQTQGNEGVAAIKTIPFIYRNGKEKRQEKAQQVKRKPGINVVKNPQTWVKYRSLHLNWSWKWYHVDPYGNT
jgi:hypothetical protein